MSSVESESELILKLIKEQRQLHQRLCIGPEPTKVSEEVVKEICKGRQDFIDRLLSRACALAANRCGCRTEEEFKKRGAILIAQDIDGAWLALQAGF